MLAEELKSSNHRTDSNVTKSQILEFLLARGGGRDQEQTSTALSLSLLPSCNPKTRVALHRTNRLVLSVQITSLETGLLRKLSRPMSIAFNHSEDYKWS